MKGSKNAQFALLVLAIPCILLAPKIGHARDSKQKAKETRIEIKDFSFQPKLITIPVGARVIWVNKDEEPHTGTSTERIFVSKALDTDDHFSFTFGKPGTYEYFCSVHPRMVAKIIVVSTKDKQSKKMDKMK